MVVLQKMNRDVKRFFLVERKDRGLTGGAAALWDCLTTCKPKTVSKKGGLRCQAEKNDSSGCKKTGGGGRPKNASGRRENH
jgi:hypothetical protein